jgi:hypothetical protein
MKNFRSVIYLMLSIFLIYLIFLACTTKKPSTLDSAFIKREFKGVSLGMTKEKVCLVLKNKGIDINIHEPNSGYFFKILTMDPDENPDPVSGKRRQSFFIIEFNPPGNERFELYFLYNIKAMDGLEKNCYYLYKIEREILLPYSGNFDPISLIHDKIVKKYGKAIAEWTFRDNSSQFINLFYRWQDSKTIQKLKLTQSINTKCWANYAKISYIDRKQSSPQLEKVEKTLEQAANLRIETENFDF